MTNIDDQNDSNENRRDERETQLGYRFGELQGLLRERMRDALSEQDLRRGSRRILRALADGPATPQELADRLPRGRRHGRGHAPFAHRGGWHGSPEWRGGRSHPGLRHQDPDLHESGPREQRPQDDGAIHGRDERGADHHGQDHHGQDHHGADLHGDHHHGNDHPHHHDHEARHDAHEAAHGAQAAFERGFERGFLRGFGAGPRGHFDPRGGFGRGGFGDAGHGFPGHDFPGHGSTDAAGHSHHDGHHPYPHHRLRRIERTLAEFTERGWVWFDGERATLTDEGRAAHDAAEQAVQRVRASLAEGIDPADWETTLRTLEQMARNLGRDDREGRDTRA